MLRWAHAKNAKQTQTRLAKLNPHAPDAAPPAATADRGDPLASCASCDAFDEPGTAGTPCACPFEAPDGPDDAADAGAALGETLDALDVPGASDDRHHATHPTQRARPPAAAAHSPIALRGRRTTVKPAWSSSNVLRNKDSCASVAATRSGLGKFDRAQNRAERVQNTWASF